MINILTKKSLILILFGLAGFGLGATPLSFLSPHFYLLLSLPQQAHTAFPSDSVSEKAMHI